MKEKTRARVERGARGVFVESRNTDDEQMLVRHADASGGVTRENHHEEDRMRDIHVRSREEHGARRNEMQGERRKEEGGEWKEER